MGAAEARVPARAALAGNPSDGYGGAVLAAAAARQGLAQPFNHQGAVGQVGQRVMVGAIDQLVLERLPLADVADIEHDAPDRGHVLEIAAHCLDVPPAAAGVAQPERFGQVRPWAGRRALEELAERRPVVRVDVAAERRAHRSVWAAGQQRLGGWAHVADRLVHVDDRQQFGAVLDQRPEALLAKGQGLLSLLAFGDVLGDAVRPDDLAVDHDRQGGHVQRDLVAVAVGDRRLVTVRFPAQDPLEPLACELG